MAAVTFTLNTWLTAATFALDTWLTLTANCEMDTQLTVTANCTISAHADGGPCSLVCER